MERGILMRKSLATTVLGALIGATLTGGAIAAATTGTAGAKACVNHHHVLALLSHGKCKSGFTKTTIGAQGPRGPRGFTGKTGPQGPGAKSEVVSLAPSTTKVFPSFAGVKSEASCGSSDVEVDLNAPASGLTYTLFGTEESDLAVGAAVATNNSAGLEVGGNSNAGLDITIRAGTGSLIRLTIDGIRTGSGCEYLFTEMPTTAIA